MLNTGFIYTPETETDYILGGKTELNLPPLREDGQWLDDLVEEETQRKQFDSFNCTGEGFTSNLEILMPVTKLLLGGINYSARALGIAAGTFPPGNSLQKVADTVRHKGLVFESYLPFTDEIKTVEEYYSKEALTYPIIKEMEKWVIHYDFKYEFVFNSRAGVKEKQDAMIEGLKYAPLAGSAYAWIEDNDLFVRPAGQQDNHLTNYVGYKKDSHWWVFDSYPPYLKKVPWDTTPMQAMRFQVARQELKKNCKLLEYFKEILK